MIINTMKYAQRIAIFIVMLCVYSSLSAQETFTGHLKKGNSEKGRVVIKQDAELDALVNGVVARIPAGSTGQSVQSGDGTADTLSVDSEKPAVKMGYRIQVYSGGNSREHKQAAEKAQAKCKKVCPELSTYVHFISPRWTCRVGNFTTPKAAEKYIQALRETGEFSTITLVRSKIITRE